MTEDAPGCISSYINFPILKSHKSILIQFKSKKYCAQKSYLSYETGTFVLGAKGEMDDKAGHSLLHSLQRTELEADNYLLYCFWRK